MYPLPDYRGGGGFCFVGTDGMGVNMKRLWRVIVRVCARLTKPVDVVEITPAILRKVLLGVNGTEYYSDDT